MARRKIYLWTNAFIVRTTLCSLEFLARAVVLKVQKGPRTFPSKEIDPVVNTLRAIQRAGRYFAITFSQILSIGEAKYLQ